MHARTRRARTLLRDSFSRSRFGRGSGSGPGYFPTYSHFFIHMYAKAKVHERASVGVCAYVEFKLLGLRIRT